MIDLSLRPAGINKHPRGGILMPGAAPLVWVRVIQRMALSLERIAVYPVSGLTPNSVWGCLVECDLEKNLPDFGRNTPCQFAHGLVFLPEKTDLFPGLTAEELRRLLLGKKHLFHPELGMVELPPPVSWEELLAPPAVQAVFVRRPEPPVFIPKQVKAFQVFAPPPDEALKQLEEEHFPERQGLRDEPLNAFEKQKLAFYQALFSSEPPGSIKNSAWVKRMRNDMEDLLRRNKNQLDRLLDMLKSDPMEGLKYAIPIDKKGGGRGSGTAEFSLFRRWFSFSPFDTPSHGGGKGGIHSVGKDDFSRLTRQYYDIAGKLMDDKEYQKAAFVYLKLLKDYRRAAQALEKGGYWAEAASIYLKYLKNLQKAAECYEYARMTREAIELYKELNQYEKAGDLCLLIGQRDEANELYEKVVAALKEKNEYLKAALILKYKMNRFEDAQDLLLRSWQENNDALNCLKYYFANIEDHPEFLKNLQEIYAAMVNERNWAPFFQALPYELKKRPDQAGAIREIAYEILAEKQSSSPWVLSELPHLHPGDPLVVSDLLRYKASKKK
jgi:tetratricopeptide (TPR) repeat protein